MMKVLFLPYIQYYTAFSNNYFKKVRTVYCCCWHLVTIETFKSNAIYLSSIHVAAYRVEKQCRSKYSTIRISNCLVSGVSYCAG